MKDSLVTLTSLLIERVRSTSLPEEASAPTTMTVQETPPSSNKPSPTNLGSNRFATPPARDADGNLVNPKPSPKPKVIELSSPAPAERIPRRSSLAIKQLAAIEQSNKMGGKIYVPDRAMSVQFKLNNPNGASPTTQGSQQITIEGVPLKIRSTPAVTDFTPPKRWTKDARSALDPKVKEIFLRSAQGWVLAKDNKLQVMTIKEDDEKLLFSVKNLQQQLETLQEHCYNHDIADVFNIVEPIDIANSSEVSGTTYNLFADYATLHPAQVALSCAWYNLWVDDESVHENLRITYELVRNNCDTDLWSKASIKYKEFAAIQRGGPLALYFALNRVLDVSENSLENLVTRYEALELTKFRGENVEDAISLVKCIHQVLTQCSTDLRTYVPQNFNESLLKILQTSSIGDFNDVFDFELK